MKVCISVIIPIHNAEKYLICGLESLKRQSFQDWEAVCIDDGSSDNSLKILYEYAKVDPRFVVYTQKNCGVSSARNKGLSLARGQYIMFMDCDDILHSQSLELAYQGAEETGADLVQFGYKPIEGWGEVNETKYSKIKISKICHTPLLSFFKDHKIKSVLVWDKIYKAELAKKISFIHIYPSEDDLYSFAAIAYAAKYAKITNEIYFYVRHPGSVMRYMSKEQYRENRFHVVDSFILQALDISKNIADRDVLRRLNKYLCERYIFKEYILKTLRNREYDLLDERMNYVLQKKKEGIFVLKNICLRYRLIYFLLLHHQIILARILTS